MSLRLSLPCFGSASPVWGPGGLRYDPCGDWIFPSVISTDRMRSPLGAYYLYYAPHDAPGGLCLAYADNLSGPWTEYEANPLIARTWPPHYQVSHVSSPHLVWIEEASRFHLYYHGENDTTRFAVTADGIHFEYGGTAVTTVMYDGISEASYARVFPCRNPSRGARYVLLFMGNNGGTRRIYAAWSEDGEIFEAQKRPLIDPPPGTGVTQAGAPWYLPWQGRNLVLFHGDQTDPELKHLTTDIYIADVGADFTAQEQLGVFFSREQAGPDVARVSDPCLVQDKDGAWRLFFSAGPRLHQFLACAREIRSTG